MSSALYEAIRKVEIDHLDESDKEELLKIFMNTEEPLIRNHIALIFSDTAFNKAVPFILKKIFRKELYNQTGTLIYALGALDTTKYFHKIVRILCVEQSYEGSLEAYNVIKGGVDSLSKAEINKALKRLKKCKSKISSGAPNVDSDYRIEFIEALKEILKDRKSSGLPPKG